jgi:hypothetical protein
MLLELIIKSDNISHSNIVPTTEHYLKIKTVWIDGSSVSLVLYINGNWKLEIEMESSSRYVPKVRTVVWRSRQLAGDATSLRSRHILELYTLMQIAGARKGSGVVSFSRLLMLPVYTEHSVLLSYSVESTASLQMSLQHGHGKHLNSLLQQHCRKW